MADAAVPSPFASASGPSGRRYPLLHYLHIRLPARLRSRLGCVRASGHPACFKADTPAPSRLAHAAETTAPVLLAANINSCAGGGRVALHLTTERERACGTRPTDITSRSSPTLFSAYQAVAAADCDCFYEQSAITQAHREASQDTCSTTSQHLKRRADTDASE